MAEDRIWLLLGKKKTGEASAEELQELQYLLSTMDNHGYAHEIIDKIWISPLSSLPEIELPDESWRKIENEIKPKSNKIIYLPFAKHRRWIAAAAIVIIVGVSSIFYLQSGRDNSLAGPSGKKINHILTQPGSKSKIELPDGTQVWLNGNSQLAYGSNFGVQSRDVTLSGEAFFDVVTSTSPRTGEKIPFIIHTGTITITVKGTRLQCEGLSPGKSNRNVIGSRTDRNFNTARSRPENPAQTQRKNYHTGEWHQKGNARKCRCFCIYYHVAS